MSFLRPIIDFVSPEMPYEYEVVKALSSAAKENMVGCNENSSEFFELEGQTYRHVLLLLFRLSHVWDAAKAVTITGVAAIGIWKLNGLYQGGKGVIN
eukprot:1343989-Amorphochlora_amoeboformis.AAC.1